MSKFVCTIGLIGLTASVFAQEPNQNKVTPSIAPVILQEDKSETLELTSDIKDMVIYQLQFNAAQKDLTQIQERYNVAQDVVMKKADEVKKAHKWGDDVHYNIATGHFEQAIKSVVAPSPLKKEATVPPTKK